MEENLVWYARIFLYITESFQNVDVTREKMSHVMRKPVYAICEQQRRRSACASAQSDQGLSYSLPRQYNASSFYIQNFKPLASFYGCTGRFEPYLVANPENRFSLDIAQIMVNQMILHSISLWENFMWGLSSFHQSYINHLLLLMISFITSVRPSAAANCSGDPSLTSLASRLAPFSIWNIKTSNLNIANLCRKPVKVISIWHMEYYVLVYFISNMWHHMKIDMQDFQKLMYRKNIVGWYITSVWFTKKHPFQRFDYLI